MQRKIKEYGLYDTDTGEIFTALILPRKRKIGGSWMRLFQDAVLAINRKKIRGESYRVLFQLIGMSDFNNAVPGTGKIGEVIGMKRASVCRAFRELKEAGILLEKERNYFLNPLLAWKGSDKQMEDKCKELLTTGIKTLQAG